MAVKTAFVLVPGAWHGAWCWERVVPMLEAAGCTVKTPELAGTGADAGGPIPGPSLETWGVQVAEVARQAGSPVILVGHSRGGVVVSQAAEIAAESIRGLVYISALLAPAGMSMHQAVTAAGVMPPVKIEAAPDGMSTTLDPQDAEALFYNTSEPFWAARARERLAPEPTDIGVAAPTTTPERFGRLPRGYVFCKQDRIVTPQMQRWLLERTPCDPVIELDTDHSPFYSDPAALCAALLDCAARFAGT
jgi:pimeloyl-ACP methyl ester carboxylesterase